MANERNWLALPAKPLLEDGGEYGEISVESTIGIHVKSKIQLYSNLDPVKKTFEVKSVLDDKRLLLGPVGPQMADRSDVRAYTVAAGSMLVHTEQPRPSILPDIYDRAVFEEEPAVALRTIDVGPYGKLLNWHEDGLVPQEFDDVQLTRDDDGDITLAEFFLAGASIRTLELTYDLNKDVIRVQKVA